MNSTISNLSSNHNNSNLSIHHRNHKKQILSIIPCTFYNIVNQLSFITLPLSPHDPLSALTPNHVPPTIKHKYEKPFETQTENYQSLKTQNEVLKKQLQITKSLNFLSDQNKEKDKIISFLKQEVRKRDSRKQSQVSQRCFMGIQRKQFFQQGRMPISQKGIPTINHSMKHVIFSNKQNLL